MNNKLVGTDSRRFWVVYPMHLQEKRVLVVGASGVLGGLISRELSRSGAKVLGTASGNESAAKIPDICEMKLLLDLRSEQSITELANYLNATGVDGVVLASGVVAFGNTDQLTAQALDELFEVNALGQIKLLISIQKVLASAGEGFVAAIPGVVAETPLPGLAAYSASKTALQGFLTAITREWRRQGVSVISARPGHTETGLASRAIAGLAPTFPPGMSPDSVAQRIVKAIAEEEKDLPSSVF